MADGVAIEAGGQPGAVDESGQGRSGGSRGERTGLIVLMLLPGALIVFMGFSGGGYFPQTPAIAALILTQILLVRVLQANHPFDGIGPWTLAVLAPFALFGALTLASALWSHSTARALIAFDRVWFYLALLALFATIRPSPSNLRWLIRGLAVGSFVVCFAGLISRVLPDVWHTAPNVANERLSYPVTYWNALGLLATLAIVLSFHLTCTLSERRFVRALAAAAIPLLAATVFFTFSRGAIAAGAIGLVVYALLARPRGLLSGALAVIPTSAVLVVFAYKANLLDTIDPTSAAAVSQGHRVALAALVCSLAAAGLRLLLAARLDPGLRNSPLSRRVPAGAKWIAGLGALIVAVVLLLALSVPHKLAGDWHRFTRGTLVSNRGDLRRRLTDASNNGRTDLWRVAVNGFDQQPLRGQGAGTFQITWDRRKPRAIYTVNAHSLYLETADELGIVGLLLLLAAIFAALVGLVLRARGSLRSIYGALFATALVWGLHAGVDWDWQMPVTTLVLFAIAGLALGPREGAGPGWAPAHGTRLMLGLMLLITLVSPVLMIGSQTRLSSAENALYASDCAKAGPDALSSIGWLDVRPEPYEVIGFCDLKRRLPRLAVPAMGKAVHYDPTWETYYALALAKAAAGMDPRASIERALAMNPHEPLAIRAARLLRTSSPAAWVNRAAILRAAALSSNDLSIRPS